MPSIIQFIHTAKEATPDTINSSIIPWNNHISHRRKFILSNGQYINNDEIKEGELVFWGEWEAQSKIIKLRNNLPNQPKYLNQAFLDNSVENKTHNTDPYVFGTNFKYLICRQRTYKILRNLEPYSMILFGSNINSQFCLDTLFIVSDNSKIFSTNSLRNVFNIKSQYYYASVQQLLNDKNNDINYQFYNGVQYRSKGKYGEIYSFSPSKVYNANNELDFIFKQPKLSLDIISDNLTHGINTSNNRNFTISEIVYYWNKIVKQIENHGLLRGVYFENPRIRE